MKEDIIKWSLTLNAEQARKELNKLQEESKGLFQQQAQLRQEMEAVAKTSGKDSEEYKKLQQQLKTVDAALSPYIDKMQALESTMSKSKLTIGELQKHLKEMQKQRNFYWVERLFLPLHPKNAFFPDGKKCQVAQN